ncbi:MAG: hypothetical protein ACREAW_01725 [Nitrososphaera sp.]
MGRTLLVALSAIAALALLQMTVDVAYAKGPIHSAEHDFGQLTVAVFLPMVAVAALAMAITFRSAGYSQEISKTDQAEQPVSSSLTVLGVILFAGGALLLAASGIYNEYGQLLLFYDSYWNCIDCETPNLAPFAALGIMTTVAGVFLIAINHRYLSHCIRRVKALA